LTYSWNKSVPVLWQFIVIINLFIVGCNLVTSTNKYQLYKL